MTSPTSPPKCPHCKQLPGNHLINCPNRGNPMPRVERTAFLIQALRSNFRVSERLISSQDELRFSLYRKYASPQGTYDGVLVDVDV